MKRIGFVVLGVLLVAGCGNRQGAMAPGSGQSPASSGMQEQQAAASSTGYLRDGVASLRKGDAISAIRNFDQAIKENPLDTRAYLILAQTYMHMQRYKEAVQVLTAASRVAPTEGEIYYLLAINEGLSGDLKAARDSAQKSVETFQNQQDEKNFRRAVALYKSLVKAIDDKAAKGLNSTGTAPMTPLKKAGPQGSMTK